jgi:5-oxopent-3-ene-1,2,5-tricarboxylate decarboxylase/2-hydroxyhepta-2,4-diene-1,7-dioate isomerase
MPHPREITGTIYGTLLNHRSTLAAMGEALTQAPYKAPPQAPVLYIRPVNTWNTTGASIAVPAGINELETGLTLGLVFASDTYKVSPDKALDVLAGYVLINDFSVPHSSVYRPAIYNRCRDGFCVIGSNLFARDAIGDPDALDMRCFINGQLQQQTSTRNLVRPVRQLIADVSAMFTLQQGDVLCIGTAASVPRAKAGDHVAIEIDGLGRLENTLQTEAAP